MLNYDRGLAKIGLVTCKPTTIYFVVQTVRRQPLKQTERERPVSPFAIEKVYIEENPQYCCRPQYWTPNRLLDEFYR